MPMNVMMFVSRPMTSTPPRTPGMSPAPAAEHDAADDHRRHGLEIVALAQVEDAELVHGREEDARDGGGEGRQPGS